MESLRGSLRGSKCVRGLSNKAAHINAATRSRDRMRVRKKMHLLTTGGARARPPLPGRGAGEEPLGPKPLTDAGPFLAAAFRLKVGRAAVGRPML
jgi:hypothetical protein